MGTEKGAQRHNLLDQVEVGSVGVLLLVSLSKAVLAIDSCVLVFGGDGLGVLGPRLVARLRLVHRDGVLSGIQVFEILAELLGSFDQMTPVLKYGAFAA